MRRGVKDIFFSNAETLSRLSERRFVAASIRCYSRLGEGCDFRDEAAGVWSPLNSTLSSSCILPLVPTASQLRGAQ